jgi:hypothetical protein
MFLLSLTLQIGSATRAGGRPGHAPVTILLLVLSARVGALLPRLASGSAHRRAADHAAGLLLLTWCRRALVLTGVFPASSCRGRSVPDRGAGDHGRDGRRRRDARRRRVRDQQRGRRIAGLFAIAALPVLVGLIRTRSPSRARWWTGSSRRCGSAPAWRGGRAGGVLLPAGPVRRGARAAAGQAAAGGR